VGSPERGKGGGGSKSVKEPVTPAATLGQEGKWEGGLVDRARSLVRGKGSTREKLDEGGSVGDLLRWGGVGRSNGVGGSRPAPTWRQGWKGARWVIG
jgi:hypothetical protein